MKTNQCPILALSTLLLVAGCSRSANEPKVFRDIAFEAALKQAAEEKKIVFIDFFTTWCGPCKMLDRTTWQDAAVISLLEAKTIPLKIDAEKEVALAKRYQIEAYPTLLLVKPDGTLLDRMVGYREAARFISEFNDALAGKTALMRAQETVATAIRDGSPGQAKARYDLAKVLAQEGKDEGALKEYLWLFDDGMKAEPSFAGVRTSFLLSSIADLGRKYPPALAALQERRDAARARLGGGTGDPSSVSDFAALNGALKEEQLTLETFDQLPANSPARKMMGAFVFDQLLASRRYADAVNAQPAAEFTRRFEQMTAMLQGESAPKMNDETRKVILRINLGNAGKQIEALAGAGKLDDARELARRVRALDDSEPTRAMLQEHLERAGQPSLL